MAVTILISRSDMLEMVREIHVNRKLVLGNSVYCDVILEDKTVASLQCEIQPTKTGHVVAKNLDAKKDVYLNKTKLKRSAIKVDDVLQIGPFILRIDPTKLTPEELVVLNTEYRRVYLIIHPLLKVKTQPHHLM